jgi:pyruvyltransferase
MLKKIYLYIIYLIKFYRRSIVEIVKFLNLNKNERIIIEGYCETSNFGDALNYPFVEYLSGKKVLLSKFLPKFILSSEKTNAIIGSIIQVSKNNCIIWGAGFISDKNIRVPKPHKIHAVRGPLTRQVFLDNNIECPESYGDPALLMPFIYNPEIKKKYKIGFLPHFVNKNSEYIKCFENNNDCLIMNILIGQDYKGLINKMLSCEYIVTSSLHGLIFAHSYNIPVLWVKYSVELEGGRFKFDDYLHTVNKQNSNPLFIDKQYTIEEYIALMDAEKINFNYKKLLDTCPFICESAKNEIAFNIKKREKSS